MPPPLPFASHAGSIASSKSIQLHARQCKPQLEAKKYTRGNTIKHGTNLHLRRAIVRNSVMKDNRTGMLSYFESGGGGLVTQRGGLKTLFLSLFITLKKVFPPPPRVLKTKHSKPACQIKLRKKNLRSNFQYF